MKSQDKRKLYDMVKKINLVEFVARETGVQPSNGGGSWKMICPMPSHKDTDPSLHIYTHSGNWFYRCYGCDSKGTIVDFCMGYLSMGHPEDALVHVLDRNGIKNDADFMVKAVKEAKVECDKRMRLDMAHILAANNCRKLLRMYNGDEKVRSWVAEAYRNMNSFLKSEDIMGIERISSGACHVMSGEDMRV